MSNSISFVGTIGRDAEVRYLSSGQAVLNISVANNVGWGDKQQTNWFKVAFFGKRAEGTLVNFLLKGQQIFVSGELTQREFQGNDGATKYSLEVTANTIDLVGKKLEAIEGGQQIPILQANTSRKSTPPQNAYDKLYGNKPSSSGENLPFDDPVPF